MIGNIKLEKVVILTHQGSLLKVIIKILKRTGSLTKLQKAMGHSILNVSLTYLRGLELAELEEEDMPMV